MDDESNFKPRDSSDGQPTAEDPGERESNSTRGNVLDEGLEYYREKADPEKNRDTAPPDDERIEVHSVWVAECYAPSHTASLLSGIRKLGWDQESVTDFFEGGVTGWLEEGRGDPFGGSSLNLSIIERPGQKRFIGSDYRVAELPDGVDHARGYAFNVLSSLTIITIQFVLTDVAAKALEKPLRTPRRTFIEEKGNVTRYVTVVSQKQEAVRDAQVELRLSCAAWFKSNLPGLFSSDALGGDFPTCEFVTLQKAIPFERPPEGIPPRDNYLWLLGLENASDVWDSLHLPGLKLRTPLYGFEKHPYALVLAGKEDDIVSDDLGMYGGRNRSGYAGWLDLSVDGLLVVWALHALLRSYEQELARLRDRAGALDFADTANAAKSLQTIQTALVRLSSDLLPLSSELTAFCEDERPFKHYAYEFKPLMEYLRERGVRLIDELRHSLLLRSKRLGRFETEVRQVLMTSGSVASAISQERATQENFRLQKQVASLTTVLVWLTIALTALGVLTIIVTVSV